MSNLRNNAKVDRRKRNLSPMLRLPLPFFFCLLSFEGEFGGAYVLRGPRGFDRTGGGVGGGEEMTSILSFLCLNGPSFFFVVSCIQSFVRWMVGLRWIVVLSYLALVVVSIHLPFHISSPYFPPTEFPPLLPSRCGRISNFLSLRQATPRLATGRRSLVS
jgi:hypothetical protein